jgi:hypothetical protein
VADGLLVTVAAPGKTVLGLTGAGVALAIVTSGGGKVAELLGVDAGTGVEFWPGTRVWQAVNKKLRLTKTFNATDKEGRSDFIEPHINYNLANMRLLRQLMNGAASLRR